MRDDERKRYKSGEEPDGTGYETGQRKKERKHKIGNENKARKKEEKTIQRKRNYQLVGQHADKTKPTRQKPAKPPTIRAARSTQRNRSPSPFHSNLPLAATPRVPSLLAHNPTCITKMQHLFANRRADHGQGVVESRASGYDDIRGKTAEDKRRWCGLSDWSRRAEVDRGAEIDHLDGAAWRHRRDIESRMAANAWW